VTITNDLCRILHVALTAKFLLVFPGYLLGHDFIVKPSRTMAAEGESLTTAVLLTELYIRPDRVLPESSVELHVVAGGKKTAIPLKASEEAMALLGSVKAPTSRTFILSGHRLASVRSGANRKGTSQPGGGAAGPVKSENFSKALINVSARDNGYAALSGDRLEIVPVTNPALVKAGGEMAVRILFDGRPVKTNLLATYDGFSAEPHKVAHQLESGADGTAKFSLNSPGLWMVRAAHSLEEPADTHSRYSATAVLIFSVQ